MSAEHKPRDVSSRPDVDVLEIIENRLALYRNVVNAAVDLPHAMGSSKHVTPVLNARLNRLHQAVGAVMEDTESLEVML